MNRVCEIVRPLSERERERASEPSMIALARRLAARAAAKYHAPGDVMESAAMLGLCLASRSFDEGRGVKFRTFAYRRILGAMADEARAWAGRPGGKRALARFVHLDDPALPIRDMLESGEEPVDAGVDFADELEGFVARLPVRCRQVFRLLYGQCRGRTLAAAGRALGLCQSRVQQLHTEGITMLNGQAKNDTRVAELLRRRAASNSNGTATEPAPDDRKPEEETRKLDDEGREEVRRLAAEHPKWSASDLADAFESAHGWRPTFQAIGRCLSQPAPRKSSGGKPGRPRAKAVPVDANAEVEAIAAVSRALAPLAPGEVRRVLDWARSRFESEE